MKNKNLIINCSIGIISFGVGSLTMFKIIEASLNDYIKKNYKGSIDKNNEILMGYYEHWKKNRA